MKKVNTDISYKKDQYKSITKIFKLIIIKTLEAISLILREHELSSKLVNWRPQKDEFKLFNVATK